MKKLLFIPVLFIVTTLFSQETLVVPDLDCAHKHQFMTGQVNAVFIGSISYAKASGKTVEDVATYIGELASKTWNKENGFNALLEGVLHNSVCFAPGGTVEILEQSNDMMKLKTTNFFPYLKKNESASGITYPEYLLFMRILISKICDYMGADFALQDTPDGWIWTLKKK